MAIKACNSIFSLLIVFISHLFNPALSSSSSVGVDRGRTCATASRNVEADEIFWDYAEREINLLLWLSLIAITAVLALKLARALRFMIPRESNYWIALPFLLRPLQAIHWQISPGGSR